jgi:hypothetical protein
MSDAVKKHAEETGKILDFDIKVLSENWLRKPGLNSFEVEWEEENGDIRLFNIIQSPTLVNMDNLQTHMMDVLFVYETSNLAHKNIIIKNNDITSITSFIGQPSPKAIILNYNDWAYAKWIVDKKSFNYLKDNLLSRVKDTLTRQLFYRSLFDMTRDAKISCPEYIDIVTNLIVEETNEDILTYTLRSISGLILYYIPLKFYPYYTDLMFKLVQKLIGKNLVNKEITMNLIDLLVEFAYTDEHVDLLKDWLVNNKTYVINDEQKIEFSEDLVNQDNRFNIVALIYKRKDISLEEKEKILENQIKRDNNSDRSVRARCKCTASLPDKVLKNELWDKFIHQPTSDSLYNMKSYMSGFAPIDQLPLVEDYLKVKFFEDALEVAKQDYFYITYFILYCSPSMYVNIHIIESVEKLAEKCENYDIMKRKLLELSDDMRRFLKAQSLAEVYLSLLNKWG